MNTWEEVFHNGCIGYLNISHLELQSSQRTTYSNTLQGYVKPVTDSDRG